ncbi:hypothetical protein DFS34DRAFT_427648 [Phlyctochytrium arcticum]|nr:hypothetical protein DFS34DRAFT_427648 [Phlyctochytrium arcticum]
MPFPPTLSIAAAARRVPAVRALRPSLCITALHKRPFSQSHASMTAASDAIHGSRSKWPRQQLIPTEGTYPKGFLAGGHASGVKRKPTGAKDLTMIVCPKGTVAASAVFTQNSFAAAPVQVSKAAIKESAGGVGVQALIVNSGCANACTGDKGLEDAWKMVKTVDAAMANEGQTNPDSHPHTLVMSTGVIGQPLNMSKITKGVAEMLPLLESSHEAWLGAAEGIMTTDTFPKLRSKEFKTREGKTYRMAGWSKGAGMIHPNMATMLSSVFTDYPISPDTLATATRHAADRSFNAISIDGDTSTNDTFAVLSSGQADNVPKLSDTNSTEYQDFVQNLTSFAAELAQLIVRDGEGATKFVEVHVNGADSFSAARQIASTIATSPLVKTALFGKDANWGRIVCAVGYSGIPVDPKKVNLYVGQLTLTSASDKSTLLHLFKNGEPFDVDETRAAQILEQENIYVRVELGAGDAEATMWTCDFSHEYISINADYRS